MSLMEKIITVFDGRQADMRSFGAIRLKSRASLNDRLVLDGGMFKNLLLWSPRLGEAITVLDSCNRLFRARLVERGVQTAVIHVFEDAGPLDCLETGIMLLSALPDKERFELIIQKTTEIGVDKSAHRAYHSLHDRACLPFSGLLKCSGFF